MKQSIILKILPCLRLLSRRCRNRENKTETERKKKKLKRQI